MKRAEQPHTLERAGIRLDPHPEPERIFLIVERFWVAEQELEPSIAVVRREHDRSAGDGRPEVR
ncbi:hypothetical protein [Polyangium jinanense]|uniref:Uncharacterized protein n=1 Tax=Polyangium jinanense TaxID=2829994 RepID=A0A9X4ATS2_9BACT|nr:hypothetical protein [Polyangium jinanense]MDC3959961.1 hypothetical protein [Polyangium jinanense]MDC3983841.1 hypothetical protein [Polyangium jinanense]